ncbi:MAG: serine/threonine-protein kinase [Pseudomonadota bacterium]
MSKTIPHLQNERYELLENIGVGAIASVWKAFDREKERPVAVKVMHQGAMELEQIQRLALEVDILSKLKHPCIIEVFGTGVWGAQVGPYVVMEWVDGINLREKLSQTPILPTKEVVHLVGQICGALNAAHQAAVVHRDLKPENVLLCSPEYRQVKVVDFGMAKLLQPGGPALTREKMTFGTPEYMSPERVLGKTVGASADIYALGIMTYEMLSGRRPFSGESPVDVMHAQLRDETPPLPEVAPVLQKAVLSALAKEEKQRPSAIEFACALGLAAHTA